MNLHHLQQIIQHYASATGTGYVIREFPLVRNYPRVLEQLAHEERRNVIQRLKNINVYVFHIVKDKRWVQKKLDSVDLHSSFTTYHKYVLNRLREKTVYHPMDLSDAYSYIKNWMDENSDAGGPFEDNEVAYADLDEIFEYYKQKFPHARVTVDEDLHLFAIHLKD